MAGKRRLPVLQNTDDEVADRPAWQGAAIVASLSVLLWVVVFAVMSPVLRRWPEAPLWLVVVLNLLASAVACAAATGIARVAVPAMGSRLAAIGGATGTIFVFVVAVAQTLRAGQGSSALVLIGAAFTLLASCNAAAAFACALLLDRRAAKKLAKK
jgi:hypothetical protein